MREGGTTSDDSLSTNDCDDSITYPRLSAYGVYLNKAMEETGPEKNPRLKWACKPEPLSFLDRTPRLFDAYLPYHTTRNAVFAQAQG